MMVAAMVLIVFNVVFWTLFEQAGSSLTLFADRNTDLALQWTGPVRDVPGRRSLIIWSRRAPRHLAAWWFFAAARIATKRDGHRSIVAMLAARPASDG